MKDPTQPHSTQTNSPQNQATPVDAPLVAHSSSLNKANLRKAFLTHRQTLSPDDWKQKSDRLCMHLQTSSLFRQARTILAYFSIRQEPTLASLFHLPYDWGFPRCEGKALVWHRWSPTEPHPLPVGKFNIPEPPSHAPTLNVHEVDLILVPAVACDHRGYRLGYGGGFYDRLLSSPAWAAKPTIGVVFEFARLPELPIDPWDRPLQAICTDVGFFERG